MWAKGKEWVTFFVGGGLRDGFWESWRTGSGFVLALFWRMLE